MAAAMLLCPLMKVFGYEVEGDVKKIKVGVSPDFLPFVYYDENKRLCGFDIDLMDCIGEKIGFEIEYVNFPFDRLLLAVASGEVDCAISAISVTEDRDGVIDYSREYLMTNIITYTNGEKSRKRGEYYAIAFRDGLSGTLYDEKENHTDDEELYIMIDKAISELSQDRSVYKLIEKYNLNKPLDKEAEYNIEYQDIRGAGSPAAKSDNDKISATSVPCSEWAKSDIEKAKALNIISEGLNYNYPGAITREEFCELIYNYCANVIGRLEPVDSESMFTDTDNSHIKILNTAGIINGKTETRFAPDEFLTREEAAVILKRMINKTISVPVTEMYFLFDDEAEISEWASEAVQVMCNMGIMQGVGENKFAPAEIYTTEQAIAAIVRVYAAQSAENQIIGGADAPTEIYIGEGVIEARMQFVINGEKDNMILFMSEMYDALGDECVSISKIK